MFKGSKYADELLGIDTSTMRYKIISLMTDIIFLILCLIIMFGFASCKKANMYPQFMNSNTAIRYMDMQPNTDTTKHKYIYTCYKYENTWSVTKDNVTYTAIKVYNVYSNNQKILGVWYTREQLVNDYSIFNNENSVNTYKTIDMTESELISL